MAAAIDLHQRQRAGGERRRHEADGQWLAQMPCPAGCC
jgi:hypothetical protein